jgi:alpha-L-fucosidase
MRPTLSIWWKRRPVWAVACSLALDLLTVAAVSQPVDMPPDPNGGLGVEQADRRRKGGGAGNKPEREQWFMDLGFCVYITWGLDSQLGLVASHSLAGASDDYINRFFTELPRTFNPKQFDAEHVVRLAKLCGAKYLMFTPKYHSGFCMWDTKTTDFSIMNTPYGKDITRMIADECHRQGVALGFYFSPDDFWFIHKQGLMITRGRAEVRPRNNPQLMEHNQRQIRELLTEYGKVDTLYCDGDTSGLKKLVWELQPDVVVTRGYMKTPEQAILADVTPGPWETAFVMGTQWGYKATNERFKSGTDLISMLIEIRAKGGNLALDVGPEPSGLLQPEQERLLIEIGLWNFISHEAIYQVRPWEIPRDGDVWFTRSIDGKAIYAIVTKQVWPYGKWQTLTLKSVRATDKTEIEMLGQSGRALEYDTNTIPKTTWTQDENGLHIRAMRAQRIYHSDYFNDPVTWPNPWPNPFVFKITHAESARQGRN